MNILSICDNPDVLQVMRIVNIVITIIKIAVPILLIIFIMIELIGAITDEEKLKKVTSGAVKKFIAAVLIFLIPTLVQAIVVVTLGNENAADGYKNCLKNLTLEQINQIYEQNAIDAITKAESTLDYNDYSNAVILVHKIKDTKKKSDYLRRLDTLKSKINKDSSGGSTSGTDSGNGQVTANKYTLYMGDSRTNGMQMVGLDSNEQAICEDNAMYKEFEKHLVKAKQVLNDGKKYNVVLNYGVNDLSVVNSYCSKYKEFIGSVSKEHTFYIMSVNPVRRNSKKTGATNEMITNFNNKIKSCMSGITNVKYCDVYGSTSLDTWEKSYISGDDIHYTNEGYKFIHSKIKNCIG